jgi:vacuolar-type H+-ATPase subunit D/Vma8
MKPRTFPQKKKIAGKGHDLLKEKRKDVLKGLRDWIDKELA